MKNHTWIAIIMQLFNFTLIAQNPILLTDQTIKLGGLGEESFYFGFHEGDQVLIDFKELRNKGLKELEIKEYQSGCSIYSDYECKKIEDKEITIPITGTYQFRFYNASLGKRIGKVSIFRLSVEGQESFNSTVYWRTIFDTIYKEHEEQYIIGERYTPKLLIENKSYINSGSNASFKGGKSRITIPFVLPNNTIEWYYEVISSRNKEDIESVSESMKLIGQLGRLIDKNTGTIGFALDAISKPPGGNVCDVYLLPDYDNASLFERKEDGYWKCYTIATRKNVKSDIIKLKEGFQNGSYYLGIKNPDSMYGIHVRVEVVAIIHEKEMGVKTRQIPQITSRKVPFLKN